MSFAPTLPRPLAHLPLASDAIRLFTPNWFAATMGTGVVALLLGQFPEAPLLYRAGAGLWVGNCVLFVLFAGLYGARWLLHFEGARRIASHGVMSMSLGCIPMGLATITNGFLLYGVDVMGPAAVTIAEVQWWIGIALALACGLVVPFLMFTRQSHQTERMTGVWLLPIVAAEVAAVTGGLLAGHLPVGEQPGVLLVSFVLWACSVPLALGLVVALVVRMIVHKLPEVDMAATSWLALGPIATGALGMLIFADVAPTALTGTGLAPLADAIAGACLLIATLLWGYGAWWVGLAALITARYFTASVPFNLGWWAYVFPAGVFTLATQHLAVVWSNAVLHGAGLAMAGMVTLIWAIVATRTLAGAWRGTLFAAPCLEHN